MGIFLAALYALTLTGLILVYCFLRSLPRREWPLVLFLFFWAALVFGGYIASAFNALGQWEIYVPATFAGLALIIGLHALARRSPARREIKLRLPSYLSIRTPVARNALWIFLSVTLGLAVLGNLLICFGFYPSNSDSLTYRLPRVFWYASHGDLLHPFHSFDERNVFYPLNGLLLHIPIVVHHLPGYFFNFPSFFCWLAVLYATYAFARAFDAERLIAFCAAWLAGLTPSVLSQATSTNDDIFAAAALLVGFYFALRWLLSRREHYVVLATLGLALSVGTKLHIVFLVPLILAGITVYVLNPKRAALPPLSLRTCFTSLFVFATIGLGFLACNYLSAKQFYLNNVASDVFNLSASAQMAGQNLLIYLSQLILAPFADLAIWSPGSARDAFYQTLNETWTPLIAPFISQDPRFYLPPYRFAGIFNPDSSPALLEFSLWPGFVWLLWLLQAFTLGAKKFTARPYFALIAFTPLIWLVIWSCATRYMEGIPVYLCFYLIVAAPALVFCFISLKRPLLNYARWAILVFVIFSSTLIGANFLTHNAFRGLEKLAVVQAFPVDHNKIDPAIIDEIKRADGIQILAMNPHVYYFAFMHWNPAAHYYRPYFPINPNENILKIFSTPDEFGYGFIPIRIPHKQTPGLTLLGTIEGVHREHVFALDNGVEQRHPENSGYIVLGLVFAPATDGGYRLAIYPETPGLEIDDDLEFSYELDTPDHRTIYKWPWNARQDISAEFPTLNAADSYPLIIRIRNARGHETVAEVTYNLSAVNFLANLRL